eukprot:scaffold375_cov299-Chaetoceros_neogracile.AAC.13
MNSTVQNRIKHKLKLTQHKPTRMIEAARYICINTTAQPSQLQQSTINPASRFSSDQKSQIEFDRHAIMTTRQTHKHRQT